MLSNGVIAFRSALVVGLSLLSGTASALSFGAGPIGGVNLASASVDVPEGDVETGILTRMAIGARAEFGVTRPYSLLLEPMFLQRGATQEVNVVIPGIIDTSIKVDFRLNYLELPILAKAKFGAMKAHGYVFAGPSLGFFLNGEAESGGRTEDADSVATFNFSGEAGAGGSYQLREFIYLNADVRYSFGFTNANDSGDKSEWKNRDIRVMACVLFHLTE